MWFHDFKTRRSAMRGALVTAVALGLSACAPAPTQPDAAKAPAEAALPGDCVITVNRTMALTAPQPGDTIEARTLPSKDCDQTVLVWTLRDREGRILHAFAAPYAQLSQRPATSALQATVQRWAEPILGDTSQAPAWEGPATEYPKSFGPDGATPLIQPVYQRVRAEKRPRVCYDTSYETFVCLYYEAESGHMGVLFTGTYQEMQRE